MRRTRMLRAWSVVLALAILVAGCVRVPVDPVPTAIGSCAGAESPGAARATDTTAGSAYETTAHTFTVSGRVDLVVSPNTASKVLQPEWRVTVSLGPWLRGSDQAGLENAWLQVSGKPGMPLVTGEYGKLVYLALGHDPTQLACLDSARAAYLFGTVTFEDVSDPEYVTAERFANPPPYPTYREIGDIYLRSPADPGSKERRMLFGCYGPICGHAKSSTVQPWQAEIPIVPYPSRDEEGTAGPHPFVVAIPDVFGPQFPDGDPRLSDLVFQVISTSGGIEPRGADVTGTVGTDIPTQVGWERP